MAKTLKIITVVMVLIMSTHLYAEHPFKAMTFESKTHGTLNYRIYIPENIDAQTKLPLVLVLHGAGERGNDNTKQVNKTYGPQEILAYGQVNNAPAIIIAPQVPTEQMWANTAWSELAHKMEKEPSSAMAMTLELIEQYKKTLPIDTKRMYVTGLSMGGFGTWDVLQRHPNMFAGAIPICGGGDVTMAAVIKDIPIWAFHGSVDNAVNVSRSRDMILAIKKAGGNVLYTEYKDAGHDVWTRTYNNQAVLDWLFTQKKK